MQNTSHVRHGLPIGSFELIHLGDLLLSLFSYAHLKLTSLKYFVPMCHFIFINQQVNQVNTYIGFTNAFIICFIKQPANIYSSYNGTKLLCGIQSNSLLKVRIRGNRDPNETMQISWSSMCSSEKACLRRRRNINYKHIQIIIKLKTWYGFVPTTPHIIAWTRWA